MAGLTPRNANYVCRAYRSRQPPTELLRQFSPRIRTQAEPCQTVRPQRRAASTKLPTSRSRGVVSDRSALKPLPPQPAPLSTPQPPSTAAAPTTTSEVSIDPDDVRGTLQEITNEVKTICASSGPPEEARLLELMDKAYQFANILVFGSTTAPDDETLASEEDEETTPSSTSDTTLFADLEEPAAIPTKALSSSSSNALPASYRVRSAQTLSESLYTLLKDHKTLISEPILSIYVRIICQLGNPEYLPEIFFLYANKAQPITPTTPTTTPPPELSYRSPSPNSPAAAIPQPLSDAALSAAILQRSLSLALAIIDTTVSTRAFRLNKLVKKATLPVGLLATTPLAAYAAASWVADWQTALDPDAARTATLLGAAAYLGTLTTVGFVAVTTWNDHHDRVRWSEGTPLRYRWLREEERLYFDRVAGAWGFQRKGRRGEEMGVLWEGLRDECGARGLVLDKTDLLPGMQ